MTDRNESLIAPNALLELADKLDASFDDMRPSAGGAFTVMCLMSDGLRALGGDGSLSDDGRGPREIAAALRARAAQ
jgi:hypothetical protein